eukprot:Nk52_evm23s210 gene=Nk52_evmTU23s210
MWAACKSLRGSSQAQRLTAPALYQKCSPQYWKAAKSLCARSVVSSSSLSTTAASSTASATSAEQQRLQKYNAVPYKVGDQLHGFRVEKVQTFDEYQLTMVRLKHEKLKAEYLHVAREDSNNVFAVAFQTTPENSKGVPHILEHTTLCGSKDYPCRDPFFKMLTRSLSTFMNAWTGSDFTMYPFSTQNQKDYHNLMSVYLDSAFFPNLHKLDFLQEGWRLEHADVKDPSSPIVYKGVVYNEMKGALSDRDSLFMTRLQQSIYPTTTYGNVSGGDPAVIPDLTYEELKNFHAMSYHPSNSKFYSYGDMNLESHLKIISKRVMGHFEYRDCSLNAVGQEKRWDKPVRVEKTMPPDQFAADPSAQTKLAISFLCNDVNDQFETVSMKLLSQLLIDGPTSPFYKALVESNLGSDYVAGSGYDSHCKEGSFTIGLQNIKTEDVEKIESIVMKTFEEAAETGFPQGRIDAILHQIELGQKHQTTKFGLNVGAGILPMWLHGVAPEKMLEVTDIIEKFKSKLSETKGAYLKDLVRKYFLNNNHRVTFVMKPSGNYNEELALAEKAKLDATVSQLSDSDKKEIFDNGIALQKEQESQPNLECLPMLNVEDIDRKVEKVDLRFETKTHISHNGPGNGLKVQYCEQPTNNVTYFRGLMNTTNVPDDLKIYLPLFCDIITKMGTSNMDYRELSHEVERHTGGISFAPQVTPCLDNPMAYEESVKVFSYCLEKNIDPMFNLLTDVFVNPLVRDDNVDRLKTMVQMIAANVANSVIESGHHVAMNMAQAGIRPASKLSELYSGMPQIMFMQQLASMSGEQLIEAGVIKNLQSLAAHILCTDNMRVAVNADKSGMNAVEKPLDGFLAGLPNRSTPGSVESRLTLDNNFTPSFERVFQPVPSEVNFVAAAFPTIPFSHPDHASLTVLAKVLSSKFLHREIREKNGAYGGGCANTADTFVFYSYRDPNTTETLNTYENSVEWIKEEISSDRITDVDMNEALLSTFSTIDSPVSPSNKGMNYFEREVSDEVRQEYRDRLFAVGKNSLLEVAEKYLQGKDKSAAIVGSVGLSEELVKSGWQMKGE